MAEIDLRNSAPNGTVGTYTPAVDANTGTVTGVKTQEINRATVSEKLARIGYSNAPLDTMLRNIPKGSTKSDKFEFASVMARGVECKVKTAITADTFKSTGFEISLSEGTSCLSKSGVLSVPSINVVSEKGYAADTPAYNPLRLHITKVDYSNNKITVVPVNASALTTGVTIAAEAKMYRVGIACDQNTAITDDPQAMPKKEYNYCQRMLCTISENAYQALQEKDVEFSLADLKEQAIFDFRLQSEAAAIFGGAAIAGEGFIDPETMQRKLHMRGVLDFDIQHIVKGDEDIDVFLNNAMQKLFSVNNGSEERILLYGAGFATKLANSKWWTKQLEANKTDLAWGVTWKMVESNFGRLRGIMDPALSLLGYENCALVVDRRHIRVVEQVPMQERKLDLQKAGIRNSHDVVLEESITLELTNPKAHGLLVIPE